MARLKNKVSGNIIECGFGFNKVGKFVYFNPNNKDEVYSLDEYEEIPMTPYEICGIECKEGWKELYEPILIYVEEYNKDKEGDDRIEITQIKEKFARLVCHFNFYTEELRKLVDKAYVESERMCEDCGSRNEVGLAFGGYYHTICFDCLLKEIRKNGRQIYWKRVSDDKTFLVDKNGFKKEVIDKK